VEWDLVHLILQSSLVTQATLSLLLILSIVSWAILFEKFFSFRKGDQQDRRFLSRYWKSDRLEELRPLAERQTSGSCGRVVLSALVRLDPNPGQPSGATPLSAAEPERLLSSLERIVRNAVEGELSKGQERLSFLATTGNVAPFIGLFGTVLGIIDAFQSLGQAGTASVAAVAPGVAEALLATAAGLLTAIPAVVGYNICLGYLRRKAVRLESFTNDLMILFEERLVGAKVPR
jgi:biopolymer transport protein TolQ